MFRRSSVAVGWFVAVALTAGCVAAPAGPPGHVKRGAPVVVGPPPVVLTARPRMVFVAEFGVSFSPDLDYDVYEVGGVWYTLRSKTWYRADAYSGPWVVIEHRHLPKGLVKIKPGQVRKHYHEHEGEGGKSKNKKGKGRDDD